MPEPFTVLKPIEWPQDKLKVPSGYGMLDDIDMINKRRVGREYFELVGTMPGYAPGTSQELMIPAPEDGDFWIASMSMSAVRPDTGQVLFTQTIFFVELRDILTGYQFFQPFTTYTFLRNPTAPPGSGVVSSLAQRQPFMQPYCLLRNGGLCMTISSRARAAGGVAQTIFVTLDGWKEYARAAS